MRGRDAASDATVGAWVVRAQAGDRAAQRALFEAHQGLVYAFVRTLTGHDDVAAELTQDTFVRAFTRLPRLRDEGAFRTWLLRIAHNLVRDRPVRPPLEPLTTDPADPRAEVTRPLEQAELRRAIDAALATLPAPQREVVVLHHLQGLEVEAVARALRLPAGTVKSRLGRARAALRRKLAGWLESDHGL